MQECGVCTRSARNLEQGGWEALEEGSWEPGSENRGLRKARVKVSWVGGPEQAHGWKMKVMMGVQDMY